MPFEAMKKMSTATDDQQEGQGPSGDLVGQKLLVGLDIGGTKTEVLIVDSRLKALAQLSGPTDASGPAGVISSVSAAVGAALAQCGCQRPDI